MSSSSVPVQFGHAAELPENHAFEELRIVHGEEGQVRLALGENVAGAGVDSHASQEGKCIAQRVEDRHQP